MQQLSRRGLLGMAALGAGAVIAAPALAMVPETSVALEPLSNDMLEAIMVAEDNMWKRSASIQFDATSFTIYNPNGKPALRLGNL